MGPEKLNKVLRRLMKNMFMMRIRKIDNRNRLYGEFEYQIRMPTSMFLEVRQWCWDTWGSTVEYFWYNEYKRSPACNSAWCFDTDYSNTRRKTGVIYLATDQEMDLFYIKWGKDAKKKYQDF